MAIHCLTRHPAKRKDSNRESALGNHDNTWHANIKPLRELGFSPYYSFDRHGCHFVALMTATAQGTVSAISAKGGKILWQYQASPQLFVMSSLACDGANAYLTAFDGTLTAIRTERRPQAFVTFISLWRA